LKKRHLPSNKPGSNKQQFCNNSCLLWRGILNIANLQYLVSQRLLFALKKIASILLLGILLFNWCGYRWVINWMQKEADTKLEAKLDRSEYDESQLIEIKVPLNMPYQTNWASFQRYDGEIDVNGIHYKYVKRKIENGQLVLKCIPNEARQHLQTARDDFFKLVNDLQLSHSAKKTNNTNITKVFTGDFFNRHQFSYELNKPDVNAEYNIYLSPHLSNFIHSTPEQPPEA
jgi:hypothetical protein